MHTPLCCCHSEVKLNPTTVNKIHIKHGKAKQLQTKGGNPKGDQGVGLQRHREGLGPPTHAAVDQVRISGCGFLNGRISVLHLGTWGENQNLRRKRLQTVFKYRLPSTSTLSLLWKWTREERKEDNWAGGVAFHPKGAKQVGASVQEPGQQERPSPAGRGPAQRRGGRRAEPALMARH